MANLLFMELGFPILLVDPPMVTVRGQQVPDVNLAALQDVVFHLLVAKPSRFTGAEVRFVRKHLRLRQVELAEILNMANHTVVSQWEGREDKPSGMEYNTEVVLRLWMASRCGEGHRLPHLLETELKKLSHQHTSPLQVTFPVAV